MNWMVDMKEVHRVSIIPIDDPTTEKLKIREYYRDYNGELVNHATRGSTPSEDLWLALIAACDALYSKAIFHSNRREECILDDNHDLAMVHNKLSEDFSSARRQIMYAAEIEEWL